ncbi:MAG TPA: hypothetical protein DIU15_19700 [Deltaproteobacteria bacterium]|nr:hypothetical protein [Deltaproteobacteria bacterium]
MRGPVHPIHDPLFSPKGLVLLLVLLVSWGASLSSCAPWTPPGDGEAKGCVQELQLDVPLASRLGISSHLEWGSSAEAVAYREFESAAWLDLGVAMMRTDFTWGRVEPERDQFDFSGIDRVVDTAEAQGVEVLAILNYGNWWATSTENSLSPPDDMADFGDYVEAVATRYRGRIRYYEIWNEQNVGYTFWHPVEDPVAYGALLSEASARLRAIDPEAVVSFGGLFQPSLFFNTEGEEYLRQVADSVADLASLVDVVAYHPYRYPFTAPESSSDSQESLVETTCRMTDALVDLGLVDVPLWITELGWHTAPEALVTGVSEQDQAAYLVRSALLAFGQGVEQFTWYTFRDSGLDTDDQEQMFGLYAFDEDPTVAPLPRAKPAAQAHATLARGLAQHDRIVDLSQWLGLDEETYAFQLTGDQHVTTALWTVGDSRTVRLPARGEAVLVSLDGSELELASIDGAYEVDLSGSPVFIEAARGVLPGS